MPTPYKKGPRCERGPIENHSETLSQRYARAEAHAREFFPSWAPQDLRRIIRDIRAMAAPEEGIPGVLDHACTYIPGAGFLELHFDGTGGVMIDPASDCTPAMLELGRALKLVLGEKCRVGRPEVCQ